MNAASGTHVSSVSLGGIHTTAITSSSNVATSVGVPRNYNWGFRVRVAIAHVNDLHKTLKQAYYSCGRGPGAGIGPWAYRS